MRIGLYTFFLIPGQIGGIEMYLRQLVLALGRSDPVNEYLLFGGEHNQTIFQEVTYPNFGQVSLSVPSTFYALPSRILRRLRLAANPITQQLQAHRLDLLHYPGTTIDQLEINTPCVVTMHDIQHEYFPQFFSRRELARRKFSYKPSAQKARRIITDTEFTKQCLVEKYGLAPHKIRTIPFGVSPLFRANLDPAQVSRVRRRYLLPEYFVCYPANPWPHKNHPRLFEAFDLMRQQERHFECSLVLSGVFPSEQARLQRLIRQNNLVNQVQLLGYVPYEDLPAIYAAATALVYPSLFEGFGLPVLEAMACGCPVICSNTTSLPEIAGEAAWLVDPTDIGQLAEAMHTLLTSPALRADLRQKGLARAAQFSWAETARQTLKVYQDALGPDRA